MEHHMDREELKRTAAYRALDFVKDGMVVGLGTGSTAYFVIEGLGKRVAQGLKVVGIPTSERTAAQARKLDIPLSSFGAHSSIDLTIDGADEVEHDTLYLIKGLGGALLREKLVGRLGDHTPIPVEVVQFGWQATAAALTKLGADPVLRDATEDHPFITDGGNYILDCRFGRIEDPRLLEQQINMKVGVVECGLFIGRTSAVVVASEGGVEILSRGT
jgi:ribose 5-phosphate isomerase A